MIFQKRHLIRHGQTDPAGIVFYPRYYELVCATMEGFFREVIGIRFGQLHMRQRVGMPTVHIESDFLLPSYADDDLLIEMVVTSLKQASATLKFTVGCEEDVRLVTTHVVVNMPLESMRSQPFSNCIRNELEKYLASIEQAARESFSGFRNFKN